MKRVHLKLRALSIAGVFAAAVILVCANIVVNRFYARWDWTSSGLYTLSQATLETLHSLDDPIEVIVFLSASDPLTASVRHMLTNYGAETTQLKPRYVDPDRDPAEFLALHQVPTARQRHQALQGCQPVNAQCQRQQHQ